MCGVSVADLGRQTRGERAGAVSGTVSDAFYKERHLGKSDGHILGECLKRIEDSAIGRKRQKHFLRKCPGSMERYSSRPERRKCRDDFAGARIRKAQEHGIRLKTRQGRAILHCGCSYLFGKFPGMRAIPAPHPGKLMSGGMEARGEMGRHIAAAYQDYSHCSLRKVPTWTFSQSSLEGSTGRRSSAEWPTERMHITGRSAGMPRAS